jgi:predicted transcriptional regulator
LAGGIKISRRNKLEIIGTILSICKLEGSSKTRIVYQANLNFKNAGLYLEWLTKRGYLIKDDRVYRTTPTGLELLSNLNDITSMINDDMVDELAQFQD